MDQEAWNDQLLMEMGTGDIENNDYMWRKWLESQLRPTCGPVYVARRGGLDAGNKRMIC